MLWARGILVWIQIDQPQGRGDGDGKHFAQQGIPALELHG